MMENKRVILEKIADVLRNTSAAGPLNNGNALVTIKYVEDKYGEWAVPIFEDGTGDPNEYWPHGYYAVNITGDSGVAILMDITHKFVERMW